MPGDLASTAVSPNHPAGKESNAQWRPPDVFCELSGSPFAVYVQRSDRAWEHIK